MAERVGFEPTVPVKVHTLSKRALSTTQPPLQKLPTVKYDKYYALFFANEILSNF